MIEKDIGPIVSVSSVYETEPWGLSGQNSFLNQVAELQSGFDAETVLEKVLEIERKMGRSRDKKWGPRMIDIDLLLSGDAVFNTKNLTLPHPEMHNRRFVLEPFMEISPETIHPILRKSIAILYKELTDPLTVKKR